MIESDRNREDDWFRQNEKELLEAAAKAREKREAERAARETAAQREALKKAHWMKCPKCGHDLSEVSFEGVMIDRCGHCEGLFFDARELEQLFLARSAADRRSFMRRLLGI